MTNPFLNLFSKTTRRPTVFLLLPTNFKFTVTIVLWSQNTFNSDKSRNLFVVWHLIKLCCSVKRGLNAFAKSIGPRQPEQSAQAGVGQNSSLSLYFLHVKKTLYEKTLTLWICVKVMTCLMSWVTETH